MLLLAALCFLVMGILNFFRVRFVSLYLALGLLLWFLVAQAGIDAAISGVLIALTIPVYADGDSPLQKLESDLHGVVTFIILPLFALANAGVKFSSLQLTEIVSSLPIGVMLGLVVGKPLGVLTFCYVATKFHIAKLPDKVKWRHIIGAALLCGIGFTMSLLIGELAMPQAMLLANSQIKVGVILGSAMSGLLGYFWLRLVK
jgi:NhaA family Na+:H+ antiporter